MSSSTSMIRRPLLSLVLLGITACKPAGGPDDSDQPATPIDADEAADVLAQQICADLFTCECPNALDYVDEAECVAMEADQIAQRIDATLAAGGSWDPECAGQMAKGMRDWECLGPDMAAYESSFSPLTCPVLKGVLGLNSNCYRSPLGDDCQAGLLCVSNTCVAMPELPVPIGGECYYDDLPCESGAYCDWDESFNIRICQDLPEAGDACSQDAYYCGPEQNDLICEAGTCTASPGEGGSCEQYLLCQPGLYCDGGQDFTCQPKRELGEGCGGDAVCPVDASCVNSLCEADPAAVCGAVNLFNG